LCRDAAHTGGVAGADQLRQWPGLQSDPLEEAGMQAFRISGHDTIALELGEENVFSQSRRAFALLVLWLKPNSNSPTILCNELNSSLFQSLLHCVDGSARNIAARFFKVDNR
jgi:hypothetical protein